MLNKKGILVALSLLLWSSAGLAAGAEMALEKAGNDVDNIASLQRGARNFMNYCSGCHSAKYVRYKTIAKDLELSEEQVVNNLMFNAEKMFETIEVNMPADDAKRWFGQVPPDLSLMARSKGTDYIYNFLRGFYLDAASPTGVDNLYLGGTSMPNVFWELQGLQKAVFSEDASGGAPHFEHFEPVTAGALPVEALTTLFAIPSTFLNTSVSLCEALVGLWVPGY